MIETILLVVVLLILVGVIVAIIVKRRKSVPTPTPTPVPNPTSPVDPPQTYDSFLQEVETVIRNNLSEEELTIYMNSIAGRIESYRQEPGFMNEFTQLLEKYNVSL